MRMVKCDVYVSSISRINFKYNCSIYNSGCFKYNSGCWNKRLSVSVYARKWVSENWSKSIRSSR